MKPKDRVVTAPAPRPLRQDGFVLAPRTWTLASVVITIAICFCGLAIFNSLLLDFLTFPIDPLVIFIGTWVELALVGRFLLRRRLIRVTPAYSELFGFLLIVGIVTTYMVFPSLPGGLPPSHHFDAVNHIILADYVYAQNALPRDMSGNTYPFFMNWYPPGGAIFAGLVSHWVGSDPFNMMHAVASLVLGLGAGLIFILMNRLLPAKPSVRPISFLATMLLFTAWNYFPGLVNERYVYAQVVSQFFALAVFFFVYLYWLEPDMFALLLASFGTAIVLICHPTASEAPIALGLGAILLHPRIGLTQKVVQGTLFVVGTLPVVAIYLIQHIQYWPLLGEYGEAVALGFDTMGVVLPTLSVLGIGVIIRSGLKGQSGFTLLLGAAVLAQPIVLFMLQPFFNSISTQHFQRSIYLIIYPMAILSAYALLELAEWIRNRLPRPGLRIAAWPAAIIISVIVLLVWPPQPFAPLTLPELAAAKWAKQNLDVKDIAIVSSIREDAYWIDVAVFGLNPFTVTGAYKIGPMDYDEWRGNPGPPDYAIVRNAKRVSVDPAVTVVYQADESAVLYKPRVPPAPAPPRQYITDIHFGDIFNLQGYDLAKTSLLGDPLSITFYWQPLHWPSARVAMFVQVLDTLGHVVARSENEMLQKRYPTQRWPIDSVVADTWKVPLPPEAGAGDYTLEIAVFDQYTGNRFPVSGLSSQSSDEINLGPIHVTIPPPSDSDLSSAHPILAHFGDEISLLSYASTTRRVDAQGVLNVTLYWQSANSIRDDYTVFVHLIDPSGRLVAQVDSPPQNGTLPTSAWQPNQIVKDPYQIVIPKDLAPGEYKIEVGLYTPSDLRRLPVAGTDHIILPQIFSLK